MEIQRKEARPMQKALLEALRIILYAVIEIVLDIITKGKGGKIV
jgi:hypothetical protein